MESGLRKRTRTRHVGAEEGVHVAGRVVVADDHHAAPAARVLPLELGDADLARRVPHHLREVADALYRLGLGVVCVRARLAVPVVDEVLSYNGTISCY